MNHGSCPPKIVALYVYLVYGPLKALFFALMKKKHTCDEKKKFIL